MKRVNCGNLKCGSSGICTIRKANNNREKSQMTIHKHISSSQCLLFPPPLPLLFPAVIPLSTWHLRVLPHCRSIRRSYYYCLLRSRVVYSKRTNNCSGRDRAIPALVLVSCVQLKSTDNDLQRPPGNCGPASRESA